MDNAGWTPPTSDRVSRFVPNLSNFLVIDASTKLTSPSTANFPSDDRQPSIHFESRLAQYDKTFQDVYDWDKVGGFVLACHEVPAMVPIEYRYAPDDLYPAAHGVLVVVVSKSEWRSIRDSLLASASWLVVPPLAR